MHTVITIGTVLSRTARTSKTSVTEMHMDFKHMLKNTEKLITDNSPLILTAIGVTGTLTTAYLTGKASFRAAKVLDDKRYSLRVVEGHSGELEPREKFELVWKLYVPAAGTAAVTIAAVIGANRVGTRRAAAMAAAYSVSDKAFSEYKEKVVEQLGKNKEAKIREEINQDRINKRSFEDDQVIRTNGGNDLCLDKFSGRAFYSSLETIKGAQNHVNYQLNNNQYASLNDFYEWIGISPIPLGEELGWTNGNQLELMFTTGKTDDDRPCHVFEFWTEPVRNFHKHAR